MADIIKALKNAEERAIQRGWDKIYWAIDVHDTIWPGNYKTGKSHEGKYYKWASPVLKYLSQRRDHCLILYTCTDTKSVSKVMERLNTDGIYFDYVNENPECQEDTLGSFKEKFYFNMLLDDKAGFEPMNDWYKLGKHLKVNNELKDISTTSSYMP